MNLQGSLFEESKPLPVVLGRIKETNEFYAAAAQRALSAISFNRERLAVIITKTGVLVADEPKKIDAMDLRFHVLTINYRTDPDELASSMKQAAFDLGFDDGIRKGRKRVCRD